jgi:rhomboid protease GluP
LHQFGKIQSMRDKISILFIPTVLTLIGTIAIYTFLHWALFIELEIYPLKKIILTFGIPFALAAAMAWIFLRPRFKVLNLERKKGGSWKDFYSFMLMVIFALPLIIAQEYIITASGRLTELTSISEIDDHAPTKYYTLQQFHIDKHRVGYHSDFDVGGKHNTDFNMHLYLALPILDPAGTTSTNCPAWLGIEYKKTISNKLEPAEKEKLFLEFASESQKDFDTKNVSAFSYLKRIENSDAKDGFIKASRNNNAITPNETILVAETEPFAARNGNKLFWLLLTTFIGSAVWLIMVLIPKLDESHLNRIKEGKPDEEARQDLRESLGMLIPKGDYFITPILIYMNVGLFIIMFISGLGFMSFKGQDLLEWGANFGPMTKDGQWWRLFTSMFLHGGLMHVLANMYGLLFVGLFLEPLLGRTKFLLVYISTGIIGSIASIWWYDATVSVGASGAIFGLYGIFLSAMATRIFSIEFSKAFLLSTVIFVGYSLLMGVFGGIDNAAHIGGLASGFVIGLGLYPLLKERQEQQEAAEETTE